MSELLELQLVDLKTQLLEIRELAHGTAGITDAQNEKIERILQVIDGDKAIGLVGMRERVAAIDKNAKTDRHVKEAQKNFNRGIAVGLGTLWGTNVFQIWLAWFSG